MKKKKDDENIFVSGTKTVDKSPRFGIIHTRVEKDRTKFSRKEKHKSAYTE